MVVTYSLRDKVYYKEVRGCLLEGQRMLSDYQGAKTGDQMIVQLMREVQIMLLRYQTRSLSLIGHRKHN